MFTTTQSRRVITKHKGESMTEQSSAAACDIHKIMARYKKTGVMDHVNEYQGRYGDVEAVNLQDALQTVIDAEEMFQTVPSHIRKHCENDPVKFLEFMQNPENKQQIEEFGLSASHLPPDQPGSPGARTTVNEARQDDARVDSPAEPRIENDDE